MIEQLKTEAGAAGDDEMVRICEQALAGDAEALAECEQVITAARANLDGPCVEHYCPYCDRLIGTHPEDIDLGTCGDPACEQLANQRR